MPPLTSQSQQQQYSRKDARSPPGERKEQSVGPDWDSKKSQEDQAVNVPNPLFADTRVTHIWVYFSYIFSSLFFSLAISLPSSFQLFHVNTNTCALPWGGGTERKEGSSDGGAEERQEGPQPARPLPRVGWRVWVSLAWKCNL